jgi:hypothetical protein
VEYRWQKPSGSRCEKSRGIGIRIRELRSAEVRVNVWQSVRWDRVVDGWTRVGWRESQHSVESSHLGNSRNRRVKTRRFNRRGCEVAKARAHNIVEMIRAVHLKRTPGASRAISALRPSRLQLAKRSSVIFRGARCRENIRPGPTASPGEVRTVRSRRTRGARLGYSPPRPSQL